MGYCSSLPHLPERRFSAATKEWFWMDENPCLKVVKPTLGRGRARFLDEDEKQALLASCIASCEPRLYPLVVMALCTGLFIINLEIYRHAMSVARRWI